MKNTIFSLLSTLLLLSCNSLDTKSLVGNWIQVMPENLPYIQGVTINADNTAQSIGMATLQYEKWRVDGKTIILFGESIGNGQTIKFSDTLQIVKVSADSLILAENDYVTSYYKVTNIPVPEVKKQEINPINSIEMQPELGNIIETEYQGLLPAADGPGIDYKLTFYKQEKGDDVVFKLILTYIEAADGNDISFTSYGRVATLKNEATKNATIYQLTTFDGNETTNFMLHKDGSLELVNSNFEKAESGLNYTLKRI